MLADGTVAAEPRGRALALATGLGTHFDAVNLPGKSSEKTDCLILWSASVAEELPDSVLRNIRA